MMSVTPPEKSGPEKVLFGPAEGFTGRAASLVATPSPITKGCYSLVSRQHRCQASAR